MYKNDIKLFEFTAKQWTENYAREMTPDDKVKKLMEMGFPEDMCRDALQRYDFDENLALNFLLGAWTHIKHWREQSYALLVPNAKVGSRWEPTKPSDWPDSERWKM